MIGIDFLLLLFTVNSISLYLTNGNNMDNSSWIFTLLNALIFGVYMNIIGFGFGKMFKRDALKTLLLVVLVILALTGFGFFGLLLVFNFPWNFIFIYNIFSTSTVHGIRFFAYNFYLFLIIYFFSFLLESEVD